eukprot:2488470-Pyramimonas_sp.AAC.1
MEAKTTVSVDAIRWIKAAQGNAGSGTNDPKDPGVSILVTWRTTQDCILDHSTMRKQELRLRCFAGGSLVAGEKAFAETHHPPV